MLTLDPSVIRQLVYLSDKNNVEVGGFGLSNGDPLHITSLYMPQQVVGFASVDFPEEGLNEFVTEMTAQEAHIDSYLRVWIHTHPSTDNHPSTVDVEHFEKLVTDQHKMLTLTREAGGPHIETWLCMVILNNKGEPYCEIGGFIGRLFVRAKCKCEVAYPPLTNSEWDDIFETQCSRTKHLLIAPTPPKENRKARKRNRKHKKADYSGITEDEWARWCQQARESFFG